MAVEKFSLPFSQSTVMDLHDRLQQTRWPDEIPATGWEHGLNLAFLRDLCEYWRSQFDWEAQLQCLSSLDHYRFIDAGYGIHFIHQRGKGPRPIPLILTHGWPGSFLEMLRILPMLTDPEAYGGDPADSFDVVVPSLPGFGFSDRPAQQGVNSFSIADRWVALMNALGYPRFGAQGGDLGAGVSTALALRHPDSIIAIHLNFIPGSFRPHLEPGEILQPEEQAFLAKSAAWAEENGAYSHIQRTRPQTAAYGLNDSPAGLAAWILEKFRDWSDCDGDVYSRFSRDELLTNITLYWMTQTIGSSFRIYFENRKAPFHFTKEDFVRVPCAIARFPKEISAPPRAWVERGYNVRRWSDFPRGGHFAAAEEPELLVQDLRLFFRNFR